ncbi:MAG TPA: RNA polymerase sigma factor [Prolixibacteraceae bacterium]|nr:RNA polymerase sigma factor [Prolixibacteraceae bacterium]
MKPINWETLYQNNAPRLKGLCRRYVGDAAIAEDLVQETFITAIGKVDTFRNSGAIEGWIRKIAINKSLQYLREYHHLLSLDEVTLQPVNETVMEQSRNKIRAAIEQASFSAGELLSVIDYLPMHHKTVFNLYVMEGYSHQQIAEMLSISLGTSKSHLSRARKKAQELLYVKAQGQQPLIQRRNLSWLLLLLWPQRPIDHLFRKGLRGFEMATKPVAFLKHAPAINTTKWAATLAGKAVIYGSLATVIAGACWLASNQNNSQCQGTVNQPAMVLTVCDTLQSIKPDTLNIEVTKNEITKELIKETPEKPAPIIIKKTIVIHDTIRIKRPLE